MNELGRLLERELTWLVLEVVQELDLRQRQLERAQGLEQVGIAVLVDEHNERVEIAGQLVVGVGYGLGVGCGPAVGCGLGVGCGPAVGCGLGVWCGSGTGGLRQRFRHVNCLHACKYCTKASWRGAGRPSHRRAWNQPIQGCNSWLLLLPRGLPTRIDAARIEELGPPLLAPVDSE